MNFRVTTEPKEQEKKEITQGLIDFNRATIEKHNRNELCVFCEDEEDNKIAGLLAMVLGSWLMVDILWVSEEYRGQHIGSEILKRAEQKAEECGCKYVFLDTLECQAPGFYAKYGYKKRVTLDEFPIDGKRFYYVKELKRNSIEVKDQSISANMKKIRFYVCPVCGNVITAVGEGEFSCCNMPLVKREGVKCNEDHMIQIETIDNEYYVTLDHSMTKDHYISFLAYVTSGSSEMVKLYPEQDISVRFRKKGHGMLYAYCNKHGLFKCLL